MIENLGKILDSFSEIPYITWLIPVIVIYLIYPLIAIILIIILAFLVPIAETRAWKILKR